MPAMIARRAALALPMLGLARPSRAEAVLDRLARTGELRILVDENDPPFSHVVAGRPPEGLEIALGRAIAEQLQCRPVFVPQPRQFLLRGLRTGQAEIIVSAFVVSAAVARNARFATPTGARHLAIVARLTTELASEEAFRGRVLASTRSLVGASVIQNLMLRWDASISIQPELAAAFAAVERGEVIAAIVESYRFEHHMAENPGAPLKIVYEADPAPIAPVIRLEEEDFAAAVNLAIAGLWRTGVIQDLYLRFTGEPMPYLGAD